ncbi:MULTISPECIES: hypothetical protein [Vibrio]|uniref:hypothetical protein n=1 Tax=Vibrio TaxID=662 RepID=UPI0011AF32AC|nr:hypothetical protein [Vibrio diazotrophicus]MCZ4372192.1 hypothetical protein [Vibrio diazotrophicus]
MTPPLSIYATSHRFYEVFSLFRHKIISRTPLEPRSPAKSRGNITNKIASKTNRIFDIRKMKNSDRGQEKFTYLLQKNIAAAVITPQIVVMQ